MRLGSVVLVTLALACVQPLPSPEPAVGRQLDPPAGLDALGPNLATVGDHLLFTWLEPVAGTENGEPRHRLNISRLAGEWTAPSVVAEGDDFFANWADFPAVVAASDGSLLAHWLAKTAEDTYAYSVFLARSTDGGNTWSSLGKLNDDTTPAEHGFVSYVAEENGIRAFWLDGREMVNRGPMSLRTAWIDSAVGPTEVIDERICDCCSTDAAMTPAGSVVVYRDRNDGEIRDISIIRQIESGWSSPEPIGSDGWEIAGCPVNGPEIATTDSLAAVAWFTAAAATPKVQVAFSRDFGTSFGEPVLVDDEGVVGRVDVVLDGEDAMVSWLASAGQHGEVRLRRISADGRSGSTVTVAQTTATRRSGFPRLARVGDLLYITWVEAAEGSPSRIRLREIPLSAIPHA